jgi:hypothetical protein
LLFVQRLPLTQLFSAVALFCMPLFLFNYLFFECCGWLSVFLYLSAQPGVQAGSAVPPSFVVKRRGGLTLFLK